MYDEDTDEDIDFIEELTRAGLKITRKRKCMENAGNKKAKLEIGKNLNFISIDNQPNPPTSMSPARKNNLDICKSMNLNCINIENLPLVEKLGDQYIELNSESLQSIPKLSQNLSVQTNASTSKQTEDPIPLPIAPCTLKIVPANVLPTNQSTSEPHNAPVYLIDCTPLSQVIEVRELPADNKSYSRNPSVSTETLTPLVCASIASTNFEDGQPHNSRDTSSKAPVAFVCSPFHSSSMIKAPTADQSYPRPHVSSVAPVLLASSPPHDLIETPAAADESYLRPDDLSETFVPPVCSPPISPSLIEVPASDQSNPSLVFEVNVQSNINLDDVQSSAPPLSNVTNASPNNRINIISDVPYHGDMTSNKKRNNKATMDPKLWERNIAKEKREKGESYLGYRRDKKAGSTKFKVKHDVFKPARSLDPPCMSSFCTRSKLRACNSISSDSRQQLFTTFWKKMSWEQRRGYICSHVMKIEKKITKNPDSNRNESRAYYLTIEHERHQVCKKMFLATLGIKDWFVRYWLEKTDCAMPPDTQTSQNRRKGPEKTDSKEYLIQFLNKLPKMPSHYCRQSTSKLYLEPVFDSMIELYRVYRNACEVDSQQYLGRKLFSTIFNKRNLALFHPKKDQCDLCCSYKIGNLSEELYNQHITKKNRARAEKDTDKLFAQNGTFHVFTQDVESVKMVPYLHASAIYYKTKLCVHNFTIYNLATKEVMCYWFDESNGRLEASVFASCVVEHISNTLDKKCLPVILYSDGCCAQNRNAILSNAILRLAIEKQVVITQKYLEKGHTQMECDSVHSAIECKVKGKEIYLPEQYVDISKKSRAYPMPYEGKLLDFSFFTDFSKDLIYKSIRPGKKAGDPVVTDIRLLEYSPDGIIKYKTCFDEELKPLPLRPTPLHRIKRISELPRLYPGRLPIANRKFQDLQDLKSVIPERCHVYYDQLPHV